MEEKDSRIANLRESKLEKDNLFKTQRRHSQENQIIKIRLMELNDCQIEKTLKGQQLIGHFTAKT